MIVNHNDDLENKIVGTYFTASTIYAIEDDGNELILHNSDNTTSRLLGDYRIIALNRPKQIKDLLNDI